MVSMSTNGTNSNPAYVLVGGVSHTPVFWGRVIEDMAKSGYYAEAVAYPTCGENTENVKQWDEVIAIQKVISKYLDAGYDVVLVTHSYGGWPGSRAIKGLDKETRLKDGHSTGIIEAVFIAAFLLPDNAPMAKYSHLPPWLTVKDNCRAPNETCVPLLLNDLDEKEQKYWMSQMAWQRNDFTAETVPDAPWKLSLPKTYIVTTNDKCATLNFQFAMLQTAMAENPNTWAIKSINSGHEPFLSQPKQLVKVLLQPRS